jgi:hypothetical protein
VADIGGHEWVHENKNCGPLLFFPPMNLLSMIASEKFGTLIFFIPPVTYF